MRTMLLAFIVGLAWSPAYAEDMPALVPPAEEDIAAGGEIDGAQICDVVVMTKSDRGPFTRFLVALSKSGSPTSCYADDKKTYWFYVTNDDNTKALERGFVIGLLMGAAESRSWGDAGASVNFTYSTRNGRREVETASIQTRLTH
jgi:hypothetical protein